jgi:hypothetical protein
MQKSLPEQLAGDLANINHELSTPFGKTDLPAKRFCLIPVSHKGGKHVLRKCPNFAPNLYLL